MADRNDDIGIPLEVSPTTFDELWVVSDRAMMELSDEEHGSAIQLDKEFQLKHLPKQY